MKRIFVGARDTDARWRDRPVEVLARSKGPGPRNALVEFDTGERVVVPTYSGGAGATLRIPREDARYQGSPGRHSQLMGSDESSSGEEGVRRT